MLLDQSISSNHLGSDLRNHPSHSSTAIQAPPQGARMNLTVREREVLGLAGQGMSNKGIAQALGISSGTVTWHLKNCYQKYGVNSREQALRLARLQEQIRSIVTLVCTCGRVHTLWEHMSENRAWKDGEQK